MSLFSRLGEKSWQTPGAEHFADPADYRPSASTVGVYLYLGVATVIFILLTGAYLMRMEMASVMEHGSGGDWRAMPDPPLLWTNTVILATSSLAWEAARRAAGRGIWGQARLMTLVGGAIGCAFLAGQLLLWWQYQAAGYYLAGNPAYAFFYLLTAVHGLHLAGGLLAGARTIGQMDARADRVRIVRNVRLCAIYWHFLLLMWVLLAGLLIST
jgi:cytochrome c oxidase subunit 3